MSVDSQRSSVALRPPAPGPDPARATARELVVSHHENTGSPPLSPRSLMVSIFMRLTLGLMSQPTQPQLQGHHQGRDDLSFWQREQQHQQQHRQSLSLGGVKSAAVNLFGPSSRSEFHAEGDFLGSWGCGDRRILKGEGFCCLNCNSQLATKDMIMSKAFQGRGGRAFLMDDCVNYRLGKTEERLLITGMHKVADVHCMECNKIVGWKYEKARELCQKYKEGKYVLELASIVLCDEEDLHL